MRIALLAPVEENVPPPKYGGTELVVSNLAEGLTKAGHEVHLYATGESQTSAKLIPVFERPVRVLTPDSKDMKLREAFKYLAIGKMFELLGREKYDIVHNHIGWRLMSFQSLMPAPMVTTLHGPLDASYVNYVYKQFQGSNYISISDVQRRPMPDLNYTATVYNGIQVEKFEFNPSPKDYVAFLGRMSPEKGPKQAIMAAKAAGVKLVMAAKIDAVDQDYFKKEIEPLIDGEQVKFIGEVDHVGKVALLKDAKALLALIQWEEPFGLFMTEAMACGTPVIATMRGSVPELVEHGKNGYIVENTAEAAATAIREISNINRQACRTVVEQRFSVEKMVEGYLTAYQKVVGTL